MKGETFGLPKFYVAHVDGFLALTTFGCDLVIRENSALTRLDGFS